MMDSLETKNNAAVFDSSKNESLEKLATHIETDVSRSQSLKSYNTVSTKSLKTSSATNIYSQKQQVHEPKMEKLQGGSQLVIGNHSVEVLEYLTEGGFAHIYKVKFLDYVKPVENKILQKDEVICLKRVIVQNQQGLSELQMEVDTMKKLNHCDKVVNYYDSVAIKRSLFDGSEITDGDLENSNMFDPSCYYEILVIMELCPNNSLLDYMNERLASKLSELEVVTIMYDITKALFFMHSYGLIHKDIKIENVLVDKNWRFKLCDFGSTSHPYPIVTTPQEIAFLSQDIYLHTTPQYRSPEMIDLYRSLPIDEKSDIWALGIFLYKLMFYTTPFELTGQFAILHSRYDIPPNKFSPNLNNLIVIMLSENPSLRPNIYQVFLEIYSMLKGTTQPISTDVVDIYQQGPYNFNKYANYQSYLHNLQYNLVTSYQQKKMIDEYMYLNVFEIAPKQPYNTGMNPVTPPSGNNNNPYLQNNTPEPISIAVGRNSQETNPKNKNPNKSNTEPQPAPREQSQTPKAQRSNGERLFNVTKEKKTDSSEDFTMDTAHVENSDLQAEDDIYKRFPSVENLSLELEDISETELKKTDTSKSSVSSKGFVNTEEDDTIKKYKSNNEVGAAPVEKTISQSITETTNKADASVKKYKSNNPFPKMSSATNTSSYMKPKLPINEQFFSPSKQPLQAETDTLSKEVPNSNYNNRVNNFVGTNTKTGSSINSSSLHNNNGSQVMSPFLNASIPSQVVVNKRTELFDKPKRISSTTTTKDLIDFSDIDINSSDLNPKVNDKFSTMKSVAEIGDLKKKFKEESPMLSGDDSTIDTTDSSIKVEENNKDPRIKNILQLRYTDIDLGRAKEQAKPDGDVLKPKAKSPSFVKSNIANDMPPPTRKSLDFRRDIFTEDMDLNDSQESLLLTPERDVPLKKHKLLHHHHHSHTTSTNPTSNSGQPTGKTRRSLDFEREIMKASRKGLSDEQDEILDIMPVESKSKTKERKADGSRQEKRKSLFGKFSKGF